MPDLLEETFETYVEDHVDENPYLLLEEGSRFETYEIAVLLHFAYSPATLWVRRSLVGGNMTVEAHGPFDVVVKHETRAFKKVPNVTMKMDQLMAWAKREGKNVQPSVLKK